MALTLQEAEDRYRDLKNQGLNIDMTRGKPGEDQLRLSYGLLNLDLRREISHGDIGLAFSDCANYGHLLGVPAARRLMGEILSIPAENILVGGN